MDTQMVIGLQVTGAHIRELRQELGQSLSEFGWTLKHAINLKCTYPYTPQYISGLEHGRYTITDEIAGAVWDIGAAFDGASAGVGGAVRVPVLAAPGQIPPDTYIPPSAKVVKCGWMGCRVMFLQTNYFQVYHHPDCKEKARVFREKQKEGRS